MSITVLSGGLGTPHEVMLSNGAFEGLFSSLGLSIEPSGFVPGRELQEAVQRTFPAFAEKAKGRPGGRLTDVAAYLQPPTTEDEGVAFIWNIIHIARCAERLRVPVAWSRR